MTQTLSTSNEQIEKLKDSMKLVYVKADTMRNLILDLLDVGTKNKFEFNKNFFCFNTLLDKAVLSVTRIAQNKQI